MELLGVEEVTNHLNGFSVLYKESIVHRCTIHIICHSALTNACGKIIRIEIYN